MHSDMGLLKEIHAFFSPEEAGSWAEAAKPMITRALPHLSSVAAISKEGFTEALDLLRDILDSHDPEDPESTAYEMCDRLADVLELLPDLEDLR